MSHIILYSSSLQFFSVVLRFCWKWGNSAAGILEGQVTKWCDR
jgi:hypothetical protein